MDLNEASDLLAVRLYRWAQAEYTREATLGFPLIRNMKCTSAKRFMHAVRAFTGRELELGLATMKMTHPRGVELTQDWATEEEKKLHTRFLELMGERCQEEDEIYQMMGCGTLPSRKGAAKKFTSYAREPLFPLLGKEIGSGTFDLSIGIWALRTYFEATHPPHYMHSKIFTGADLRIMNNTYDYLRLFGFGALQYDLLLTDEDRREAAESMFQACSRFIEPLPSLLDGLTLDQ